MQDEATVGRHPFEAMRTGTRKSAPKPGEVPEPFALRPGKPSEHRADEARERRHRESAIASWLRSLSR